FSAAVPAPSIAVNTVKIFPSAQSDLRAPASALLLHSRRPAPERLSAAIPALAANSVPPPDSWTSPCAPKLSAKTPRPLFRAAIGTAADCYSRMDLCPQAVPERRKPCACFPSQHSDRTVSARFQNIALRDSARCTSPPKIPEWSAISDAWPQHCPL